MQTTINSDFKLVTTNTSKKRTTESEREKESVSEKKLVTVTFFNI